MAIIQFENGKEVEFEGNPTPADVDYVAKQLGITSPSQRQKPITPIAPTQPKTILGKVAKTVTGILGAKKAIEKENYFGQAIKTLANFGIDKLPFSQKVKDTVSKVTQPLQYINPQEPMGFDSKKAIEDVTKTALNTPAGKLTSFVVSDFGNNIVPILGAGVQSGITSPDLTYDQAYQN